MKRRNFIKLGSLAVTSALFPSVAALAAAKRKALTQTSVIEVIPENTTRYWLGKSFWGNRLQDWRVNNGRIECIREGKGFEVRTFSILNRFLNTTHQPARISATVGNITPNKAGFCGFLIGAGAGELNYKGSALTQRASGVNGGFMAVIDANGELSFKDFSSTESTLNYERIKRSHILPNGTIKHKKITLDCHIDPVSNGKFDVRLVATDATTKKELGFIVRTNVPAKEVQGGILMLSSTPTNKSGARWWFKDIATGGSKIDINPEHELGPVMGCLHSVNKNTLKLSAQFMPVSESDISHARLDYQLSNTTQWIKGPVATIEDGYIALFRHDNWDSAQDYNYRVVNADNDKIALYQGQIVKDPKKGKELKIALYSCITATSKSLDADVYKPIIKEERTLGRYTKDNILFPHTELVKNCDAHQPDLYVFCGDQFYEGVPTQLWRNKPDSKLDLLYRWYLWYWSFAESVRSRPAILLADDHDVLQGNLWGVGGKDPTKLKGDKRREEDGGYTQTKDLVQMVYRIEHGHNPDAYDSTPIEHGIPVTYGAFVYGGVSFALIEDRKFKSRPNTNVAPKHTQGELLGTRQEEFLSTWANMDKGLPKICITASIWGSPQTKGNLTPLLDYDSNGYPPDGRTRAVQLIKDANAMVICGDQHLAMVTKQGLNTYEDGPLFFAGPAGAAFWQRWFEGDNKLKNQYNNDPNTGNFIDTFGNKMRVLAVANPKVSYSRYRSQIANNWSCFLSDGKLKSEGYGIVKVNHQKEQFLLECWPWDADPSTEKQFTGWPYHHPFSKT